MEMITTEEQAKALGRRAFELNVKAARRGRGAKPPKALLRVWALSYTLPEPLYRAFLAGHDEEMHKRTGFGIPEGMHEATIKYMQTGEWPEGGLPLKRIQ